LKAFNADAGDLGCGAFPDGLKAYGLAGEWVRFAWSRLLASAATREQRMTDCSEFVR
jgi:hypothetical protein